MDRETASKVIEEKKKAAKHIEAFLKQIKPGRVEFVEYKDIWTESGKSYDEIVTVAFVDRDEIKVCVNLDSIAAMTLDVLNAVIYK